MAVDYFILRQSRFSITDMYEPSAKSIYYYRNGVNSLAIQAFIPSSIIALTLALVPAFSRIAPFGWFIGAALGAIAYYVVAKDKLVILPPGAELPAEAMEAEVHVSQHVPPPGEATS